MMPPIGNLITSTFNLCQKMEKMYERYERE